MMVGDFYLECNCEIIVSDICSGYCCVGLFCEEVCCFGMWIVFFCKFYRIGKIVSIYYK